MNALSICNIPSDWTQKRFDSLFNIQQGKQVSKANREGDNQQPFLRTRNISWGRIEISELDKMHFSQSEERRLLLQEGDLLICEGGAIGRSAIWKYKDFSCFYQNHIHRARAIDSTTTDSEFFVYWLWYAFEIEKIYFGRANVTTIPNLSKSRLGELLVPLPPISEQRKISALLNMVQQAIEQQERLIDLATELKKTLMHKLFTEGFYGEPQKETEIGLIAESWRVDSMKSFISNSKYGLSIKGQDSGSIPILRMTNQVEGYIDTHNLQYVNIPNDVVEKYRVCRGDLLFNRTNSFELVGRTALFDIDGDFVFASYLIRITLDLQQMMPEFINFYLNWDETQQRLKSIATRSVSQSNISASRLGKFLVAIPPMDEQLALVNVFQILDDKRNLHLRKRALLIDLFQTLLHQLMTAQIRVNDLDLSGLEEQLKE
jgi:type I restriction enzyme S subunit